MWRLQVTPIAWHFQPHLPAAMLVSTDGNPARAPPAGVAAVVPSAPAPPAARAHLPLQAVARCEPARELPGVREAAAEPRGSASLACADTVPATIAAPSAQEPAGEGAEDGLLAGGAPAAKQDAWLAVTATRGQPGDGADQNDSEHLQNAASAGTHTCTDLAKQPVTAWTSMDAVASANPDDDSGSLPDIDSGMDDAE